MSLKERRHQRRGRLVRKVGHQDERPTAERLQDLRPERVLAVEAVRLDERHLARRRAHAVRIAAAHDLCHVAVELAGHHLAAGIHERLGEGARAGADLEHQLAGLHVGGRQQLAQLVVVMQEVLAELVLRADTARRQFLADLGQRLRHQRAVASARVSRSTVTLISPGKVISCSTCLAISCAILNAYASSAFLASTTTRTSRPAWMA